MYFVKGSYDRYNDRFFDGIEEIGPEDRDRLGVYQQEENMHTRLAEQDAAIISWNGWETSIPALRERGWVIIHRPKYFHAKNWRDSEASNSYLYLRHPTTKMIARLKWDKGQIALGEVDFMIHEKKIRTTFKRVFLEELSEDDIPMLLQIVIELQSKRPKKKYNKITEAEILQYKAA